MTHDTAGGVRGVPDRHLGAMPLLVMHAHSGTSPAFVVCAQAVVRYGMWIT